MTDSRCPDAETLAAFVDGRLENAQIEGLSNHLIDCERCYETVAATARFLAGAAHHEDVAPRLALLPALLTGAVMALMLTVSLLLLLR